MTEFPVLSTRERDRRWAAIRAMLRRLDLGGLVVFGLKGRERYEGYLANESVDGVVIFPREGDPVELTWAATRILRRLADPGDPARFWCRDVRLGCGGAGITAVLREKGLAQGRIGVVGIDTHGPAESEGVAPYKTWAAVREALPGAAFVEISRQFSEVMIVKSPEEIAMVEHACLIGERACQAMLDATRPGVSEYDIFAAVLHAIYRHGAATVAPHLNLTVGTRDLGWGPPVWTYRGGPPRIVQKGDMVQAEIFPCYGGLETQQQLAVAAGAPGPVYEELARVARQSYEAGVAAIRPGVTFAAVCEAMEGPVAAAGFWHLTPLIHSMNPTFSVSGTCVGIKDVPGLDRFPGIGPEPVHGGELVLAAGMVFELEPNACTGDRRVNIGGTVVVTEDGARELNDLATRMQVVD